MPAVVSVNFGTMHKLPPVDGFKPNIQTRCCNVANTMCHDVPNIPPWQCAK